MTTATAPTLDDLQTALTYAVEERAAAKAAGDTRRIALANRAWSFALGAVCTARRDAEVAAKTNRIRNYNPHP